MAIPFIGCSGFSYADWCGPFYPEHLPRQRWFSHYCQSFDTVELNVTFYRLLQAETFARWGRETPSGFAFSVKGSCFITHVKRLIDPAEPLERFFAGIEHLGTKLHTVLWQFPPSFSCDRSRLHHFAELLHRYPVRQAFEFRHADCCTATVADLCRDAGIALCMADWPMFIDQLPVTADFVYLRRHGRGGSYATSYSAEELAADARRIRGYLEGGRDVYFYFNNDIRGYAPNNALELKQLLTA